MHTVCNFKIKEVLFVHSKKKKKKRSSCPHEAYIFVGKQALNKFLCLSK